MHIHIMYFLFTQLYTRKYFICHNRKPGYENDLAVWHLLIMVKQICFLNKYWVGRYVTGLAY